MTHPEDLLAEYVDGTLTRDERAGVDAHLAGCERCREEVALATRARGTLSELPEVDLPEGFRPRVRPVRVPGERFRRTGIVAGAAAASVAAVLAVVLVGHGFGGGGGGNAPELGAAPRAAAGGHAYDRNRVDSLAASLAQVQTEAAPEAAPVASPSSADRATAGGTSPGSTTTTGNPNFASSLQLQSTLSCVQEGARLAGTGPIRPVIRGTFEGEPVFIGAFRQGDVVRVWVVSRADCSKVLYTTAASIR